MNVGIYCPHPSDTTSLYRGLGPFGHIAREWSFVNLISLDDSSMTWPNFQMLDVLVMQKPCTPRHKAYLLEAKRVGVKIIVDIDDLTLQLDPWNKAHTFYSSFDQIQATLNMLMHADQVWCATNYLAENVRNRNLSLSGKVRVIPNAVDIRWYNKHNIRTPSMSNQIVWRGGDSHLADVLSVSGEFKEYINSPDAELNDVSFKSYGWHPWPLTTGVNQDKLSHLELPIFQYQNVMSGRAGIVPLADTPFNRSKSNIAWLELTMCGIATVAPEFHEEFNMPGVVRYTPGTFIDSIKHALKNAEELHAQSKDYVLKHFTLEKINPLRVRALEGVL